ncbi:MAG: acylphosphatase [Eubacterium sp.]|jgi:acylphosphatase|nr:acylphosphatase [Eubacterium sp.]MBR6218406.1 acylphosphatase [Eubacterium sp.]
MEKVREHFIFRGNVQGVGFRYTAKYAARAYGMTGWVRNNYDGSVEMELQGEPELFQKVLQEIYGGTYIDINDIERKRIPVEDGENSFKVRFM